MELEYIKGFSITEFPFHLEKVGDLIYFEGSLMGVYTNQEKAIFIYDWADSDSDVNRWMVYQVEPQVLKNYISKEISHFQLLSNTAKDIIFIVDKRHDGSVRDCYTCSSNNLPYDYLPQNDIYFEKDDSLNLEKIISFFQLNQVEVDSSDVNYFDILKEAKKENNELINLHIKSSSRKVGYGKIYSSILGQVLSNYHSLSESTALNLFDPKGKIPKDERPRRKKGELKDIKELAELEFIYAKAASFSVFLRPIKKTVDLFDNQTSSEKISTFVFKLFEASNDLEKLKEIKGQLNESMLSSYNTFLKEIKEQDISIGIQYANPKNQYKLANSFNAKKAISILSNLNSLEYENKEEIKAKGSFKALDAISFTFKFETTEGDVYIGKFSDQLKEGIYHFNLQDFYMVTIEILEQKKSGKKKVKEKDTMVSCVVQEK